MSCCHQHSNMFIHFLTFPFCKHQHCPFSASLQFHRWMKHLKPTLDIVTLGRPHSTTPPTYITFITTYITTYINYITTYITTYILTSKLFRTELVKWTISRNFLKQWCRSASSKRGGDGWTEEEEVRLVKLKWARRGKSCQHAPVFSCDWLTDWLRQI